MAGPFDDPEVQKVMRKMGVVHRPGLADELLREIGPLLAEDGFDIDNLEATDLDTLNAAIGRAVERRNFERFVPVDQTRAMASSHGGGNQRRRHRARPGDHSEH